MKIKDSVAFVTGANRGLGLALLRELQQQGVKKVYAGVRDTASIAIDGVIPVQLDVTDGAQVAAAAAQCGDVNLLINNAGIAIPGSVFDAAAIEAGAAMVNILSVSSWINGPGLALYAASKSAAWGVTNGLRTSLAEQGTLVAGVHVGFIDTDLTKGIDLPKLDARDVAAIIVAGIAAGQIEIVVDEISRKVKENLTAGIYLAPLQR